MRFNSYKKKADFSLSLLIIVIIAVISAAVFIIFMKSSVLKTQKDINECYNLGGTCLSAELCGSNKILVSTSCQAPAVCCLRETITGEAVYKNSIHTPKLPEGHDGREIILVK